MEPQKDALFINLIFGDACEKVAVRLHQFRCPNICDEEHLYSTAGNVRCALANIDAGILRDVRDERLSREPRHVIQLAEKRLTEIGPTVLASAGAAMRSTQRR